MNPKDGSKPTQETINRFIEKILNWIERGVDENQIVSSIRWLSSLLSSSHSLSSLSQVDFTASVEDILSIKTRVLMGRLSVTLELLRLVPILLENSFLFRQNSSSSSSSLPDDRQQKILNRLKKLKNAIQKRDDSLIAFQLPTLLYLASFSYSWISELSDAEKSFFAELESKVSKEKPEDSVQMLESLLVFPIQKHLNPNSKSTQPSSFNSALISEERFSSWIFQSSSLRFLALKAAQDSSFLPLLQKIVGSVWQNFQSKNESEMTNFQWEILIGSLDVLQQFIKESKDESLKYSAFFGDVKDGEKTVGVVDFSFGKVSASHYLLPNFFAKQKMIETLVSLLRFRTTNSSNEEQETKMKVKASQMLASILKFESNEAIENYLDEVREKEALDRILSEISEFPGYKSIEETVRELETGIQNAKNLSKSLENSIKASSSTLNSSSNSNSPSQETNLSITSPQSPSSPMTPTQQRRSRSMSLTLKPMQISKENDPNLLNNLRIKEMQQRIGNSRGKLVRSSSQLEIAKQKKEKIRQKLAKAFNQISPNDQQGKVERQQRKMAKNQEKLYKIEGKAEKLEERLNEMQIELRNLLAAENQRNSQLILFLGQLERVKSELLDRNGEERWKNWSIEWKGYDRSTFTSFGDYNQIALGFPSLGMLKESEEMWKEDKRVLLGQIQVLHRGLEQLSSLLSHEKE